MSRVLDHRNAQRSLFYADDFREYFAEFVKAANAAIDTPEGRFLIRHIELTEEKLRERQQGAEEE